MTFSNSTRGCALWLLLCGFTCCTEAQEARRSPPPNTQGAGRSGRLAPPAQSPCPRNNLTVYSGRVIVYKRQGNRTLIRVRTDWDTTEDVVLRSARRDELARMFLLHGEPFDADDWTAIEISEERLRPGVRVNAWVCDNGAQPLIDWQPGGSN
ncbi:MAG: hypothetical protein MSG64_16950 [Pyrinomonadaceae bacterium MAG19_C2-C3]|nr:hypothetical protein [Pyrinomonadaceae bacterium MAG19_C2-C3]